MAGSQPKVTDPKSAQAKQSRQVAALPFRRAERGLEILLVTSRETRRWIIPKGWPMKGKKPHRAAEREALEEAGVKGRIARKAMGTYEAWKRLEDHFILCEVRVYPLQVEHQRKRWREQGQRQFGWFMALDAADLVDEPGLRTLIRAFAEKGVKKRRTPGTKDKKEKKAARRNKAAGKDSAPAPTPGKAGKRESSPSREVEAGHGR